MPSAFVSGLPGRSAAAVSLQAPGIAHVALAVRPSRDRPAIVELDRQFLGSSLRRPSTQFVGRIKRPERLVDVAPAPPPASPHASAAVLVEEVAAPVAPPRAPRVARKGLSEDSGRRYLQEIGEISLLKAEDEIELAKRIETFRKLEKVKEHMKWKTGVEPTDEEWARAAALSDAEELRHMVRVGTLARDRLVRANLRWVVAVAKKYHKQRGTMSMQDLIQEGNIGLIRAVEKFDPRMGYRFTTYATWWIRQAITRSIQNSSREIRLPAHRHEKINRIKRATVALSRSLGRQPTEAEIAEHVGLDPSRMRKFVESAAVATVSLDVPINESDNQSATIGDFIRSENEGPADRAERELMRESVARTLAKALSEREYMVLRMRFGLDDGEPKTLNQVGETLGVTRERVRQIEMKALRKLRRPGFSSALRDLSSD
eukprot:tig00000842_g4820.t1